jgi:carbon monoxide dehydrogenase subunit G
VRIEESIVINQSPEQVYAFVANVNNLPRCSSAIREVRNAPDRLLREGDTYTSVASMMGRTIETAHTVRRALPPQTLEIDGLTGSTRILVTITVEPLDGGTRITQRGEGEPSGALRFLSGMVERAMRRQIRDDLKNMKSFLEDTGQDSAPTG